MKKIKIRKKDKNKIKSENPNISAIKKKWKKSTIMEKILIVVMLGLVSIFILGFAFAIYIVISAPDFDIENLYTKDATIIYDAENNEIARLGTENRERVTYEDLPDVFVDALVATEDSRYFQHNGVDLARFMKATIGQLLGSSGAGGASTLTMQIVKQRYTSTKSSGIEGIIRKFTDIYMSVFKLEKQYTKEQLIEYYVNIPGLGSGAYGIEQASQTFFGKSISEVNLAEASLLAGLFQAPSAYNPYNYPELAEKRRATVLNLMVRHGYITEEEANIAKAIPVTSLLSASGKAKNRNQGFINTVVEEVVDRTGKDPYLTPMKIYSTMIQSKQDVVNSVMDGTKYKWPNEKLKGGIAVTDVKTGAIVAIGANRNNAERNYNYATMINRHPGSTAKPIFDYGPAIETLNWSTGQMLVDDEYAYSNGVKLKNHDGSYKGIMTAKTALAGSRNIPAVYTFQQLDQKEVKKIVTGLGITPEYDSVGYINESHAIGGFNGTNPLEMSAAYATFARGGVYIEPYSFTKLTYIDTGESYVVTPEKRSVLSPATSYMITYILKYAVTSGSVGAGSKSGTDVCGKTGTSTVDSKLKKQYNITKSIIGDSWQVNFTPQYSYSVWLGYDKISENTYLTNSVGGPAKKAISKILTSGLNDPNQKFTKPSTVVSAEIELGTNPLQLASDYTPKDLRSTELFKIGTVPESVSNRFSKLTDPSNLKINTSPLTIGATLSWTPAPLPDAASETALQEYFKNGYGVWADKYFKQRLTYNANNIGAFGYDIYINNGSGDKYLGFTTSTTYSYNGIVSPSTKFTVKSAYNIFKNNASNGISQTVSGNTENTDYSLELNGASMTVGEYLKYEQNNLLLKVFKAGNDISTLIEFETECVKDSNGDTDCSMSSLDCKLGYTITHKAYFNNKYIGSVNRTLTPGC